MEFAMLEEISLMKNGTLVLVKKPPKSRLVGSKWVFKLKEAIERFEPLKYKKRVMAQGYSQRDGVDYNEEFSPITKYTNIRILLSIVTRFDLQTNGYQNNIPSWRTRWNHFYETNRGIWGQR